MTSWMERAFNRTFAERLARIVDEIERIQSETDRQALQVGDRALIERSLKIMREEAQRLLQFSADSDLDPTKQ
jgi:DNA-directed RNA polymerase beta subunit